MLSLVLPTYNEADNLPELIPAIEALLAGLPHEVIVRLRARLAQVGELPGAHHAKEKGQ